MAISLVWGSVPPVPAHELRGFAVGEGRLFTASGLHPGQKDVSVAAAIKPEYFHRFPDETLFTLIPFYRIDSADDNRTRFDLRELSLLIPRRDWELRLGVRQLFHGVTETVHLVDIVTQTDLVESPDAEEKLGQPMANLSLFTDWGIFDFYVLPFFRERTFPGRGGRIRSPFLVDTSQTQFESPAAEWHTDYAFRYFNSIGKWDLGITHFVGTSREPTARFGVRDDGELVIVPFYEQIVQTGLDILYVAGSWIWKLEMIRREGLQQGTFVAWTGGFEYTFSGVLGTGMDLGVLSEWSYDDRGGDATTPFENDITVGARLAVNDIQGTQVLAALVQDIGGTARSIFIESSSRLTDHWRATLEYRAIFDQESTDPFFFLRNDDFLQFELAYHF